MTDEKRNNRAIGMTQISISLPQRLVDKVDRLAASDNRSRSNYIAYLLDKIDDEFQDESLAYFKVAESKSEFDSTR